MNDTQQEQLFGLLAAAQEQQQAVEAAIAGLATERTALAKERAALAQATASVADVAGQMRRATAQVVPAIQKAAGDATGAAVRQSLAGAAQAATSALSEATQPVISSLSRVVKAASDAEGSMRNAGAWFAWKWVAVAAGGMFGVCLLAYVLLGWQLHQVEQLTEQKAALNVEVARLQANVEDWAKRGGRATLAKCGEASRPCVRVDKTTGYGKDVDYYVLRGY